MRKTAVNFFYELKKRLVSDHKILLLSLIVAVLSFPEYTLFYVPGIDGPLPWVFNYFANGHYLLEKEIIFPHGLLAFMLYPLPVGNNLVVTACVTLACSFLLSSNLFKISFFYKNENYMAPFLLGLLLQSLADLQLLLVALTLSHIILYELNQKKQDFILPVFFAVLNLHLKTYGGVICGLVLASYILHLLFIRKNYKLSILLVLTFFAFFFLFRLFLFHTLGGAADFLIGQLELSSDNSEAVAYYQLNNWWWLGISLLSFLLIPFFSKERMPKFVWWMMLLPFFAAWKHAMCRADGAHILGYLSLLFVVTFILWLVSDGKKIAGIVLSIVSLSSFTLNMAVTAGANDYATQKNLALLKPYNLYNLVVNYDSLCALKTRYSKDLNATEVLPDTLLKLIGNSSADVYPWNYSIIAVNNLNWVPRPSLHSYAAYTHWLDEKNAAHILSGKSAQFLIWEININGGRLAGIDYRYLLNDGPETMLAFFSNYTLTFKSNSYLVFEKLPAPLHLDKKIIRAAVPLHYGEWTSVPVCSKNSILRAKVKIKKSLTGHLKSLLYKGEAFSVFYETEDGRTYNHKIVPKNAADGLWINPLVMHPETDFTEPQVKKIKLVCWDERMVKPEFELEFEEIKFDASHDFLLNAFHKKDSLTRQAEGDQ